jgi:hypothetical protein
MCQSVKSDIFDRIRNGCRAVSERATHVRINHESIFSYAASLPLNLGRSPEIDPASHYMGQGSGTAAFLVTLDAINFGSGYFPRLRKRAGMSGYFTIASSLNDHFKKHGPMSAGELAQIRLEECARIFNQDLAVEPVPELMGLFATALNDLGRFLIDCFDGSFEALIESADSSAEKLLGLLSEMPFFNDVASYQGFDVPFFKRAQITAADLSVAFRGEGLGRFHDLDRLTIFADNLVPHVLRVDGVLLYEEALICRIERGELIPAGSPEEIEIRACGLHAVELIREALEKSGLVVPSMRLDYLLWNRGQNPYYKKISPRHRTRSVFY